MTTKNDLPQESSDDGGALAARLRGLRDIAPPPSLVPAVMQRIAEPRPFSLWAWLRRPHRLELRVTPLGLTMAAGFSVLVLVAVSLRPGAPVARHDTVAQTASSAPAAPGGTAAAQPDVVLVRFVLQAKGAKQVALAGDFNAWRADAIKLEDVDGEGTFVATVPLPRGSYEYMFLVDGRWVTDPSAAELRPDGFGRRNGVLRL